MPSVRMSISLHARKMRIAISLRLATRTRWKERMDIGKALGVRCWVLGRVIRNAYCVREHSLMQYAAIIARSKFPGFCGAAGAGCAFPETARVTGSFLLLLLLLLLLFAWLE